MNKCNLCPRNCGINRENNQRGFCGETVEVRAARAALHMWEEPCISGKEGSGTVFFTGCVLKCVFCQNSTIAAGHGMVISIERLAEIFLEQQGRGANNINLVTPTHFVPEIRKALILAKDNGLKIPVVYNTGSYETVETLKMMEGLVDIYLPDLKFFSSDISKKYANAADYFDTATAAIAEMVKQVGEPEFFDNGIMKKGVIVRHLLLPGCLTDSKAIVKYLYETYGNRIYISLMNQYTPMEGIEVEYPELNRRVSKKSYDRLVDYALNLGIENGFIQDGDTAKESFIPNFNFEGIEDGKM